MKYYILIFSILVLLVFFSCVKDRELIIDKAKVGVLNDKTRMDELESIYSKDSLVVVLGQGDLNSDEYKYFHQDDQYMVYEHGGKHLLTIVPMEQHDSSSTIKSVAVFDERYKTKKGISIKSPFKDIILAYSITITNTPFSAHIDIDALNATMSIDKKEIGINEFNRDEIKPNQIPDLAGIKHFTIWFN